MNLKELIQLLVKTAAAYSIKAGIRTGASDIFSSAFNNRKKIIGQRLYLPLLQNCCNTMALGIMETDDSLHTPLPRSQTNRGHFMTASFPLASWLDSGMGMFWEYEESVIFL